MALLLDAVYRERFVLLPRIKFLHFILPEDVIGGKGCSGSSRYLLEKLGYENKDFT